LTRSKATSLHLLDPEYLAQVAIDDGQLVWPNGAKFEWAYIYKWDEHLAMLKNDASPS
jgi:hypothetical protein